MPRLFDGPPGHPPRQREGDGGVRPEPRQPLCDGEPEGDRVEEGGVHREEEDRRIASRNGMGRDSGRLYCEGKRSRNGIVVRPFSSQAWCDLQGDRRQLYGGF